ncbi:MAG TPA: hypothetical protein VKF60_10470 [Myxococcota bacterium]|nr:hypothetical protein [Myxococcota bacterium]
MGARRVLCLAAVLALVCLGQARGSAAATPETVDLTPYLDGFPEIGDFHMFNRSDGQTLRAEILDVREGKKSTGYETEYDEAGDLEQEFSETVHGQEERLGSAISGDLVFATRRPKRVQSFVVVPGMPQSFKVGSALFYHGRRAGKATLAGTSTFVGFEPVSTPLGDFAEAAHFHREQTFTIKVHHSVFQTISISDSWITVEFGTVFAHREAHSYQDGFPLETFGPFDYTLDHGQYQGVPYP